MPATSQKDIAQKLGVSTATVSIALSGRGSVSKELAERVQQTAAELGYRPNPILSSLASSRFRDSSRSCRAAIALLNFLDDGARFLYEDKIAAEAEQLGYVLSTYTANELAKLGDPSRSLYHRGVQGLIVLAPIHRPLALGQFDWSLFSVVFCGRFHTATPYVTVRPNVNQAIRDSYFQAVSRGYRRIGFAIARHQPIIEDDEERLATVLGLQAIHERGQPAPVPPFFDPIQDLDAFVQWYLKYRPDAIIGFRHEYLQLLLQQGLRIPADVAYANLHLDGPPRRVSPDDPRLYSGMVQNRALIAQKSLHALDQTIRHRDKGGVPAPEHILVPSTWFEGDTLPHRPA